MNKGKNIIKTRTRGQTRIDDPVFIGQRRRVKERINFEFF